MFVMPYQPNPNKQISLYFFNLKWGS